MRIKRLLKWFVFGLAVLLTVLVLAWQVENIRGRSAWRKHKAEALAKGEILEPQKIIPPEVPNESNFAAIPLFLALFDFKPGTQDYKDPKAAEQARHYFKGFVDSWASGPPPKPTSSNTWVRGLMDLRSIVAEMEGKQSLNAFTEANIPAPEDLELFARRYGVAPGEAPSNAAPVVLRTPGEAAQEVIAALEPYQPGITQIEEAAKRPYSRFPVKYDNVPAVATLLPHLASLRSASEVFKLRALAYLELGKSDEAAEDVMLILRLADSVKDEPILISYLVRIAIRDFAIQPLAEGLARHAWNEAQLRLLENALVKTDILTDLHRVGQGEVVFFGIQTIDEVRRGIVKDLGTLGGLQDLKHLTILPDGWFYFETINYHNNLRWFLDLARENPGFIQPNAFSEYKSNMQGMMAPPHYKRLFNHTLFSGLLLPALDRILHRATKAEAEQDIAALACAMERYWLANARYPEELQALTPLLERPIPKDPIGGGPLHYRLEGTNSYAIWSVGWDGKDDGGKVVHKLNADEEQQVQHDWVWRPVNP